MLTIDTKPRLAPGECATGLPKFVRGQTTAFDNVLEGADGDWLAAVHGNDDLPPVGMAPFLVAAALAQACEAMRPENPDDIIHSRSAEYMLERKKPFPMCSLRSLTCLQVQVLPRQWMVGPSSHSRLWLEETPTGASSAVNGRASRRRKLPARTGQPL